MSSLFSSLVDNVFPALGRFFGILASFAMNSFDNVKNFLTGSLVGGLGYTNVFTGETDFILHINPLAGITSVISDILDLLVPGYFDNLPFVFAILVLFAEGFVVVTCLKGLTKLIL